MNIEDASDQALRDELEERALERTLLDRGVDLLPCEECRYFKAWTRRGDPPETFNPCSKRHTMRFRMPEPWEDPHSGGYFRLVCSDRQEPPPPEPEPVEPPPKWPPDPGPRGTPDWHLQRKPV